MSPRSASRAVAVVGAAVLALAMPVATASAEDDPRVGLAPGYIPWTSADLNVDLLDNDPRVAPFDALPGNFGFVNSDLAFTGSHAIVGSFNGFQVYDLSDPTDPELRGSFVCPGGQGDVSVFGDLLFMSVEETRGRIDCGTQGAPGAVNLERFRGVRIFDISDLDNPVQLPGVQTCRGSHTHTLVTDPDDPANVYVYNSGTSGVRSPLELPGCENAALTTAPVTSGNPTQWRIDVIKVPLAAPETAAVVSQPRIFTDPATGAFNGLQNTQPGALHPSGTAYSPLPNTNTCHDVTAFPAKQLVAGACQGNGILLDVSDPVNPVRLDAVSDPNFSYWHSATFNNDGTKVIFTDEWGGGTSARCRVTDQPQWGADALFDIEGGSMEFASYYKMPAVQTSQENCVAHNMSLVPVPGRDIFVQAWYQGGLSVVDFSDTANPVEIGYFDRGPINTPEPDRAQPRWAVVDLLVQRPGLRQRDRPRLRHLRPRPERPAQRERDRRGPGGRARRVQRPAPGHDHLGAELRGRRCLLRPGGALGRARRRSAEEHRPAHRERAEARRRRADRRRRVRPAGRGRRPARHG